MYRVNETNEALKKAIARNGMTQADVARELNGSAKVFNRKINRLVINGYEHKFNERERNYLSERFNVKVR